MDRALKAADALQAEGVSAAVVNMHTWKPIDADAIVDAVKETGALVTCENHSTFGGLGSAVSEVVVCENHSTFGGLGSAVSEVVVEKCPAPVEMIGVVDSFGEVGKQAEVPPDGGGYHRCRQARGGKKEIR